MTATLGHVISMSRADFDDRIELSTIIPIVDTETELAKMRSELIRVPDRYLDVALDRLEAVRRYKSGLRSELDLGYPPGTVRRWVREVSISAQIDGNVVEALVPQFDKRGLQGAQLAKRGPEWATIEDDIASFIKEKLLTAARPPAEPEYQEWKKDREGQGKPTCSYPTLLRRLGKLSDHQFVKATEGEGAAYRLGPDAQPHADSAEQVLWLEHDTPPHGDYPYQIAHGDHTPVDYIVTERVYDATNHLVALVLGPVYLSWMQDACTRLPLAMVVSFEHPSSRTVMRLLRQCVRRHGALPEQLVLDNAPEFHSTYIRRVAKRFGMHLLYRPSRKPRAGNILERTFGKATVSVLRRMLGNTQARAQGRGMSTDVDPVLLADHDFEALVGKLATWFFRIYAIETVHETLGLTPQEYYNKLIRLTGVRTSLRVRYTSEFEILTMPAPPGMPTRKVQRGRGVRVFNMWYSCEALRSRSMAGKRVAVRIDPDRFWLVHVLVHGRWEEATLKGRYQELIGDRPRLADEHVLEKVQAHNRQSRRRQVTAEQFLEMRRHLEESHDERFVLLTLRGENEQKVRALLDGEAPPELRPSPTSSDSTAPDSSAAAVTTAHPDSARAQSAPNGSSKSRHRSERSVDDIFARLFEE